MLRLPCQHNLRPGLFPQFASAGAHGHRARRQHAKRPRRVLVVGASRDPIIPAANSDGCRGGDAPPPAPATGLPGYCGGDGNGRRR